MTALHGRVGALLSVLVAGGAAAGEATMPPFRSQQASSWCWAAASQMVLEHLDQAGDFSQALQAEKAFAECTQAPRNTCGEGTPFFDRCDRPGFPSFGLFDHTAETDPHPLPWDQLKSELDACRPLVFGWCIPSRCGSTLADSSGHWMVAAAADVCPRAGAAAVPMVRVFNPAPCCNGKALWLPYALFASGGAAMDFWANSYRVRPAGTPPPTVAGTACRLSEQTASPEANFETDGAPADLVREVLASCLGTAARWRTSTLLRPPPAAEIDGQPEVGAPIRRRLISLAALPGLRGNRSQWQHALEALTAPALWVFPVRVGGQPVASVVLEEWRPQRYRLQAVEDSDSTRRLLARSEAARASDLAPDEFILVEIGLPFSYTSGGSAVVVTSEAICRRPPGQPDLLKVELASLFDLLQPLAAPFAPP